MKNSKIKSIIVIILGFLLITGCEDSTGPTTPENATISGTITFTGYWPSDGDVAVSLSSTWPPAGAPAASSAITESELSSGTYAYTFENVTFGTYAAIAVSWQDPDDTNPATNQHILGAYGATASDFNDATSITVSAEDHEQLNRDFDADLSLAASN